VADRRGPEFAPRAQEPGGKRHQEKSGGKTKREKKRKNVRCKAPTRTNPPYCLVGEEIIVWGRREGAG